jgi:hypothetical protein
MSKIPKNSIVLILIFFIFAVIYIVSSTNSFVTFWSACDGNNRSRTVTQATNESTACTATQNVIKECYGTNGGTACTATQIDCSSNYSIIKDYYDKKGKWKDVFTMQPINSNKVSETQCDVAYNYNFVPGGGRNDNGIDKRRFTLSFDNINCTWDVTEMGGYESGITVR